MPEETTPYDYVLLNLAANQEYELEKKHGQLADKLHTALHEVVGHASGQLNPGVGETKETLKNYASTSGRSLYSSTL